MKKIKLMLIVMSSIAVALPLSKVSADEPCCSDTQGNCQSGVPINCFPALTSAPVAGTGNGSWLSNGGNCGVKKVMLVIPVPCGPAYAAPDSECF